MKLTSTRLALLAISFTLLCSSCKDEESPTQPLEGNWTLFSAYVESQLEIHSRNTITDEFPCFYDDQAASPLTTSANKLAINADQTGSYSWSIPCTPAENYGFTWRLSGDNELTLDHFSGETWVWKITSLSSEFMDVEFSRERSLELPISGPATKYESFSLRFKKVE
ncbi:MAG: hypothetical protein Roseis2KO_20690 [Roseivirga sp.]